ncbi:MAG: 50S ribosomal protein L18Ae [Thermofilaceae archaeon]|nr:50S ribosomal protein L18Ae [Thermofilaceae archaeon]MCX8180217.1 50S ribosomal protein L18Ae [Thermofilaceae archaeon]MDW8003607.1 50S ribosomal protein L18Ae [Thermofilaceae archaeon]
MQRSVRIYRVSGLMNLHRLGRKQNFSIVVTALKAEHAIERVLSELGSRHKLKRTDIVIKEVKEISEEEVNKTEVLNLIQTNKVVLS